jgi:hypothetical protein
MKPETIEALALELTKATIENFDSLIIDKTSAKIWIKVYNESLDEIKAELAKDRTPKKPATAGPLLSNY